MLTIMGGIAEFERGLIRKRCEEGIERAKAKGKQFGRPTALDAASAAHRRALRAGETMAEWRASTSAVKRRFGGRSDECPLPSLTTAKDRQVVFSTGMDARSARTSPARRSRYGPFAWTLPGCSCH